VGKGPPVRKGGGVNSRKTVAQKENKGGPEKKRPREKRGARAQKKNKENGQGGPLPSGEKEGGADYLYRWNEKGTPSPPPPPFGRKTEPTAEGRKRWAGGGGVSRDSSFKKKTGVFLEG